MMSYPYNLKTMILDLQFVVVIKKTRLHSDSLNSFLNIDLI